LIKDHREDIGVGIDDKKRRGGTEWRTGLKRTSYLDRED